MTENTRKRTLLNVGFSLLVGFITILIFSKSSPLYPFNTWTDPNCFFTVGASALDGVVTYRDIFDHKGPLLYLLHTLAALISRDTFLGVFLIQAVFCAMTHYYAMKIASLYGKITHLGRILSVPLMCLCFATNSYYFGDSAEEFVFPVCAMAMYIVLKAMKEEAYPSRKELVLLGIGSAFAFWTKFNLCGFFLAVIIFLIVFGLRRKEGKKVLSAALWFALSCIGVSVLSLLYSIFTGSLKDVFTVYFYDNIFLYKGGASDSILGRIPLTIMVSLLRLTANPYMGIMILVSVIYLFAKNLRKQAAFFLGAYALTAVFIFIGEFPGFYYAFALAVFTLPGWAAVFKGAEMLSESKYKKLALPVVSILACGLCVLAFFTSASTPGLFEKKEDLPQYKFGKYMNKKDSPTLLNYGFLDQGFYTLAGITPSEKHFCTTNIEEILTEAKDAKEEAIAEGRIDFIVTKNKTYDWTNYKLVGFADWTEIDFEMEEGTDRYYLYEKIEDEA